MAGVGELGGNLLVRSPVARVLARRHRRPGHAPDQDQGDSLHTLHVGQGGGLHALHVVQDLHHRHRQDVQTRVHGEVLTRHSRTWEIF